MGKRDASLANIYCYTNADWRVGLAHIPADLYDLAERAIDAAVSASRGPVARTATVLADWVIPKPAAVPEADAQTFYDEVTACLARFLGEERMIGSCTDGSDLHCLFVPIVRDRNGAVRLQLRQVISAADYRQIYETLNAQLSRRLGYKIALDPKELRYRDSEMSEAMRAELQETREAFADSSKALKKELSAAAEAAGISYLRAYSAIPKAINKLLGTGAAKDAPDTTKGVSDVKKDAPAAKKSKSTPPAADDEKSLDRLIDALDHLDPSVEQEKEE